MHLQLLLLVLLGHRPSFLAARTAAVKSSISRSGLSKRYAVSTLPICRWSNALFKALDRSQCAAYPAPAVVAEVVSVSVAFTVILR
jgi:hypothetical protein